MLMQCINHDFSTKKTELKSAHQRLLDALRGIPVQFRSVELSDAIRKMEEIETDEASIEAILAHGDYIVTCVKNAPTRYITNKAVNAVSHFETCLEKIK